MQLDELVESGRHSTLVPNVVLLDRPRGQARQCRILHGVDHLVHGCRVQQALESLASIVFGILEQRHSSVSYSKKVVSIAYQMRASLEQDVGQGLYVGLHGGQVQWRVARLVDGVRVGAHFQQGLRQTH